MKSLRGLFILSLILTVPIVANNKPAERIEIKQEEKRSLEQLESQYRESAAQEEAARAKKENAQLRYVLAVSQLKAQYKVTEDYRFDDQAKSFVLQESKSQEPKEQQK